MGARSLPAARFVGGFGGRLGGRLTGVLGCALLASVVLPAAAWAQADGPAALPPTTAEEGSQPDPRVRPAAPESRLRLAVTPYAWLPSFSGELTARGIEFDASASFSDIVEGSDNAFGLMGAIDFGFDALVFQLNGAWTSAEIDNARGVLQNGEVRSDLEFDATWVEAFAGWRFIDEAVGDWGASNTRKRITLDGFVGARVTFIDVDTTVAARTTVTLRDGTVLMPGQQRDQSQSEEWIEPFVGLRVGYDLGNGWSATVRGDVGGFGVEGSKFSWQAEALVGYRWDLSGGDPRGWDIGVFGGYRALGQDYSSGDFGWDMLTYGPVVGARIALRF